jgi:hypothetical protein
MVEHHLVEIRIRGNKPELLYLLVEDDPVCVRTEIDRTAKARPPDFAAFPMERLGLALRIGRALERGTQQQINGSK